MPLLEPVTRAILPSSLPIGFSFLLGFCGVGAAPCGCPPGRPHRVAPTSEGTGETTPPLSSHSVLPNWRAASAAPAAPAPAPLFSGPGGRAGGGRSRRGVRGPARLPSARVTSAWPPHPPAVSVGQ